MRRSLIHKLTLLPIIMGHLAIYVDATYLTMRPCRYDGFGHYMNHQRCHPRFTYRHNPCFDDYSLCGSHRGLRDCLLPGFFCDLNFRCIPRRHLCNGIPDCSDGSDEWGCVSDTLSSASESTSTIQPDSTVYTSSHTAGAPTILQDNEGNNTLKIFSESDVNTISTETNRIVSFSNARNTVGAYTESINSNSSSGTSTRLPHSEAIPDLSSSAPIKSMTFQKSESYPSATAPTITRFFDTNLSSSTITNTMLPNSEFNTSFAPSTKRILLAESSSKTALSFSTSRKTTFPTYETDNPTVVENTTPIANVSSDKISSSTMNTLFAKSRAKQSCPENYCMQNAECIVIRGQYRCQCPSSFIGELCEVRLGIEFGSHEYTVIIAMTLVILCLGVVSVCTYRYKRSPSWKSRDGTTRTLSQLTLASHAVE